MEQVETEISKFENEDAEEEVVEEDSVEGKKQENEEEEYEEEEKKKKVKRGSRKERKRKEEHVVVEIPVLAKTRPTEAEPELHIPGLKNVKLTSLTQKIMGCIVGEHVTAEDPWTTISKVVVDENLYLHHESSDFLPVKDELSEYTDNTILVGYDPNFMPYEDEDFHRFYIAVTESARDMVVAKLMEEKRLAEERLRNSINKRILPWESLGSEEEVDANIVRNSRPLIQLELETDIDEFLKPVHFKDREVEDAKDGYVRIGPGRQEFIGIEKLRVDAGTQAVPAVVPEAAQTDPGLPTNAWTQYLYDMTTAQETLQQCEVKELKPSHIFPEREYLERALEYNEHFDLYVNDYPLLVPEGGAREVPQKSVFNEYEAYTDVNHCKDRLISSIAWHPMWSGVVALSYSVAIRCVTACDVDLTGDEVLRDVFSKNSVLLWSFVDALNPRLVLQSPREVHCLAWSPIDPHVLVGGCASGQIIIWDLKGKLEAVEGHEYLTSEEQRYRLVMQSLIGWLQPQPPAKYVRPAALSDLQFSHAGKVTDIQWIPPYFEWTENGHYERTAVDEGKTSMEIITCGEDGVIMIWDLSKVPEDTGRSGQPKRRKTRKRPSALTAQISPFKACDRRIRPIYLLYPELPSERFGAKLTALSMRTFPITYKPKGTEKTTEAQSREEVAEKPVEKDKSSATSSQNETKVEIAEEGSEGSPEANEKKEEVLIEKEPVSKKSEIPEEKKDKDVPKQKDSLNDVREDKITSRKTYQPVLQTPKETPLQILQVTTDEGDSVAVKWEGFEFHKGEEITTEQGAVVSFGAAVHDGPVVTCVRSPFLEDLVLTIGGRVIALWNHNLRNRPLFWKYRPVGVTCGSWSPYRPCIFHIGRSDGSLEVWNLNLFSEQPALVQSISGKVLTYMCEHTLPLDEDQSVLGVADYNKSFRLLHFPSEFKIPKPAELETLRMFVNREIDLRESYAAWNEKFTQSNAEELARLKAKEEEAERKRREAELSAEQEAQLRAKMEEEEARRMAKAAQGGSLNDRFLIRLREERERQMQRVLMEKKQLNKSDLLQKQQPILMMKQMEKEKRRKQKEKIRQQQKIFDKTVAMLFPEVVEKPQEGPSRMEEFEAELMRHQPQLMAQYDEALPAALKLIQDNPFNKRLKWEKVFEEGMFRRNVLDFPLYLRKKRQERFREHQSESIAPGIFYDKKTKVGFREKEEGDSAEEEEEEESGEGGEEEDEEVIGGEEEEEQPAEREEA